MTRGEGYDWRSELEAVRGLIFCQVRGHKPLPASVAITTFAGHEGLLTAQEPALRFAPTQSLGRRKVAQMILHNFQSVVFGCLVVVIAGWIILSPPGQGTGDDQRLSRNVAQPAHCMLRIKLRRIADSPLESRVSNYRCPIPVLQPVIS